MNHESDPPDSDPPAEKIPAPEMPPESVVDRLEQDERAREVYEREQRTQRLLDSTDEMFRISDELAQQRESESPASTPSTFDTPQDAQAVLDRRAEIYDREWEAEESKVTPRSAIPAQLRETLAKKGLRREAPTAEEVDPVEIKRAPNHARQIHHRRGQSSKLLWRPKGPHQYDMRDADERVKTQRKLRGDL
jgi:hypothetical protein